MQTNNYFRVSSVQTIVCFTCLKKISLYSTCRSDLEVTVLTYLGINTILPGNLLSIETYEN